MDTFNNNNEVLKDFCNRFGLNDDIIIRYRAEARSIWDKTFQKYKEATEGEQSNHRWVWELFQNSVDTLNSKDDKISLSIIVKEEDGIPILIFEHNGGYFKSALEIDGLDDFENFIRPGSGKSFNSEDKGGKFGTGFLSTHCLSSKIKVEGICENHNGERFYSKTELDRSEITKEDELSVRLNKLRIIKSLYDFEQSKNNTEKSVDLETKPVARFTYYMDNHEKNIPALKIGIKELLFNIPYVMAFNSQIERVSVKYFNSSLVIENKGCIEQVNDLNIYGTQYKLNEGKPFIRQIAVIEDKQIQIGWRVEKLGSDFILCDEYSKYKRKFNNNLPRLFCRYPLIGSDDFQFPVIINSNYFRPNEKRHGINLKESNLLNKELLNKGVALFQSYLSISSRNFKGIYNIVNTRYIKNPSNDWIDFTYYDLLVDKLRQIIIKEKIIDISQNIQERKAIIDQNNTVQIYFPNNITLINGKLPDLGKIFYFSSKLLPSKIPSFDDIPNWHNILWESPYIKQFQIKEIIMEISRYETFGNFSKVFIETKFEENAEENSHTIQWLNDLYTYIINDLGDLSLLNLYISSKEYPIVPSRSGKFKLLQNLKKDLGYESKEIDDTLLNIHSVFYPLADYKSKLLKKGFSILEFLKTKDIISEEGVAQEIITKTEEFIDQHDKLIKTLENKQLNDTELKKKNEIEQILSNLQVWISKNNTERKYFKDSMKRKILQTIIDEKKSENLTKLLELDRDNKISLQRQGEILSDPELEIKISLGKELLNDIRTKEGKDKDNRELGKHFEDIFKALLIKEGIKFEQVDGEQDVIINPNLPNEYYIELKSISNQKTSVYLTPDQAKKYSLKKEKYFLCIIPFEGDFKSFHDDDFIKNAKFNNSLSEILTTKSNLIEEFAKIEKNIAGVFPETIIEKFHEKPYKFEIKKEAWFGYSYEEVLKIFKESL